MGKKLKKETFKVHHTHSIQKFTVRGIVMTVYDTNMYIQNVMNNNILKPEI